MNNPAIDKIRIGACQTPEFLGNPMAALKCMLRFAKEGEEKDIDLLLFPECFLSGYRLDKEYMEKYSFDFQSQSFANILKQLKKVKAVLVFGVVERKNDKLFNSAVVVNQGELVGVYRKTHLIEPAELIFTPGEDFPVFELKGLKYGINICYDAQFPDAARSIADQGAKLLLLPAQNMLNAAIAERWKYKHNEIRSKRVKETGLWFISSDVTGVRPADQNSTEYISYGPTLAMNPNAEIIAQVSLLKEGMIAVDIPVRN